MSNSDLPKRLANVERFKRRSPSNATENVVDPQTLQNQQQTTTTAGVPLKSAIRQPLVRQSSISSNHGSVDSNGSSTSAQPPANDAQVEKTKLALLETQEFGEWIPSRDSESRIYFINEKTKQTTFKIPHGWRKVSDSNGNEYFFQTKTKETVWEEPEQWTNYMQTNSKLIKDVLTNKVNEKKKQATKVEQNLYHKTSPEVDGKRTSVNSTSSSSTPTTSIPPTIPTKQTTNTNGNGIGNGNGNVANKVALMNKRVSNLSNSSANKRQATPAISRTIPVSKTTAKPTLKASSDEEEEEEEDEEDEEEESSVTTETNDKRTTASSTMSNALNRERELDNDNDNDDSEEEEFDTANRKKKRSITPSRIATVEPTLPPQEADSKTSDSEDHRRAGSREVSSSDTVSSTDTDSDTTETTDTTENENEKENEEETTDETTDDSKDSDDSDDDEELIPTPKKDQQQQTANPREVSAPVLEEPMPTTTNTKPKATTVSENSEANQFNKPTPDLKAKLCNGCKKPFGLMRASIACGQCHRYFCKKDITKSYRSHLLHWYNDPACKTCLTNLKDSFKSAMDKNPKLKTQRAQDELNAVELALDSIGKDKKQSKSKK